MDPIEGENTEQITDPPVEQAADIQAPDTQEQERTDTSDYHALYMPISYMSRSDDAEWIVEGQATAEVPDTFGTIFTYEASKKAFQNWLSRYANVREMHGKKAAGKGISLDFDDENKRVLVRTRVSKGAPDTWIKFQEGVLSGFSVGAGNVKMGRMQYQGKSYPAIIDYDLVELSYVDNPSCPGSDAQIVMRADGNLEDIIDDSEPETPPEQTQEPPQALATADEERAGARLSGDSKEKLHGMRDAAIQLCACDECQGMVDKGDEPDGDEAAQERMQAVMTPALERSLSPIFQRHNAILARYAQFDTHYIAIQERLDKLEKTQEQLSQLDEIKATLERMANASTLDEVRVSLETVKDRVEQIAKTPMPGGPIQNGARPPYEKTNPYQPEIPLTSRSQIEHETVQRLHAQGAFQTQDDQIAAAALMLQPMHSMRK
jgi:phage head maturation protease